MAIKYTGIEIIINNLYSKYIGTKIITNNIYSNLTEAVRLLGENFASESDIIRERNRNDDFDSDIWKFYGWTRGMRLIPNDDRPYLIARNSILLDKNKAQEAADSNLSGKFFYVDEKTYKEFSQMAKEDKNKLPEKMRVFLVPQRQDVIIQDGNDELLRFYAQGKKEAKEYFSHIKKSGRKQLISYMPDNNLVKQNTNGIFVQQSYFKDFNVGSGFYGDSWNLGCGYWAFGVSSVEKTEKQN
ncbi:MAG: hypothetical protein AABW83_04640 [Nanoarchaeota archaeon]